MDPALSTRTELQIEGKRVRVSNLDKVLYPKTGFTKGDVLHYYIRMGPTVLPHLKNRPLTLKRYPEGVEADFFYEKKCPSHRPEWVKTADIWSRHKEQHIRFCLANDLPTLVWTANLADLELHTSLALAQNIERPTMVVFDLDPGPPVGILECCQVALWLKQHLDQAQLANFAKTSGSKGLQVYVPLNTATNYEATKNFARSLAHQLERGHPDLVVSKMTKKLRHGKVFVDWSQNDEHKTTVCAYSLRAREIPSVSTPVTWDEVGRALKSKKPDCLVFVCEDVLKRVEKHGDLFEPVLKIKQRLPKDQSASQ
jgi:bifunctional non-homologous end joining protein LigD